MSNRESMYKITFKRHPNDNENSWIIDKLMVGYSDLYVMCDNVMVHYPESVKDGNFIKIEEAYI